MPQIKNKKTENNKLHNNTRKNARAGNEAWRIRRITLLGKIIVLILSGMLMAASMPPLNWSAAAWIALIPLYWICSEQSSRRAAASGFFWGLGWGFTAFYWLREIDPVIPYLLAPVIALFPAAWSCLVPVLRRGILIPNDIQIQGYTAVHNFIPKSAVKTFFYAATLAAWWCISEWFRARLLPWNYVSASQWQNLALIQICSITGTYGVSFLIVLTTITLAIAFKDRFKGIKNQTGFSQAWPFYIALLLILLVTVFGASRHQWKQLPKANVEFNAGLIQGNISQRRQATLSQALEAMDVYLEMSYKAAALKPKPDIIIWPETATPFPYRGDNLLNKTYRRRLSGLIKHSGRPMVLGTIDFEKLPPSLKRSPGITNSAFLLDTDGRVADQYNKIQRVPFGEYIPFRKYLPEWIIKRIDMHRDLVPGSDFSPLEILPGVRAGISICYEDIFEYISRQEALENANLLLVITNDAWYPTSSEPEQHLANCVFRTIETGLPMLRCGNNSASCLIQPDGFISDCLFKKKSANGKITAAPDVRGQRAGIIKVKVPVKPKLTFYSHYGNVFLRLCWLVFLAGIAISILNWRKRKMILMAKFEGGGTTRAETDKHG